MRDHAMDTAHALRRAREEAHLAVLADEPAVARAHYGLSVLHADHARRLLSGERPIGSAFPQFSRPRVDIIEPHAVQERVHSA